MKRVVNNLKLFRNSQECQYSEILNSTQLGRIHELKHLLLKALDVFWTLTPNRKSLLNKSHGKAFCSTPYYPNLILLDINLLMYFVSISLLLILQWPFFYYSSISCGNLQELNLFIMPLFDVWKSAFWDSNIRVGRSGRIIFLVFSSSGFASSHH